MGASTKPQNRKNKQKFHKRPQETPLQKATRRREFFKNAEYKSGMDMYRMPDGSLLVSGAYYEQVERIELEYQRELRKQQANNSSVVDATL